MQSVIITGGNLKTRRTKALQLAENNSSVFDIKIFDTKDSHGIDLAREIITETSRKPYESKLTSIVILESQHLTEDAQNALLKLLEEPNESLQLILTSFSKPALLPTIASRLQEITLASTDETDDKNQPASQSLNERLDIIAKSQPEEYLKYWEKQLFEALEYNDNDKVARLHRYNKLLIKMQRARKSFLNSKLIDLIIALETPETTE